MDMPKLISENFVIGFGRAIDIWGKIPPDGITMMSAEEAFRSDLEKIGGDFKAAISTIDKDLADERSKR